MKIIPKGKQPKIRRQALEILPVYDLHTNLIIGEIVDLSTKGMKLKGENAVLPKQIYYCRIPLKKKIDGYGEVFVDAECRWCKIDAEEECHYSGYVLRYPSQKDAGIINKLTHRWMAGQSEKLNAHYTGSKHEKRGWLKRIFKSNSDYNPSD